MLSASDCTCLTAPQQCRSSHTTVAKLQHSTGQEQCSNSNLKSAGVLRRTPCLLAVSQGQRVGDIMEETQPRPIRIKLIPQLEGSYLDDMNKRRLAEQLGPAAVNIIQKYIQVRLHATCALGGVAASAGGPQSAHFTRIRSPLRCIAQTLVGLS